MLFNILNNTSLIRKKQLVLWSMWEKYYLDNIINSLSRDQGSGCMLIFQFQILYMKDGLLNISFM